MQPAVDPAKVAATILLEWAMAVRAVSAEDLRRPGAVTVVAVPTSEWAPAACDAWIGLVSGHGNTSTAREHSVFYQRVEQTVVFVRDKSPPEYERTLGDDVVASGMWLGQCLVGFSPDDGWLPRDLVTAADHRLTLAPLFAGATAEVARRLTGTEPTFQLAAAEAEAVGPRLLRLARRPGQTADQYLGKIRDLVRSSSALGSGRPETATVVSPRSAITLDDLAGMDEAVAWGRALHDDLAAFGAGRRAWADVDRGVLLSGPTGCGKTTYAKALACTCGVPLVEGSWSRWLATGSGHQGSFMLAMRKTFAEAREQAPSILFLDEIDSFPDRATLAHDHKDWDIQCVNGLLAELDGVQGREGVVVVAACNHPHLLDAALTRSGRLDRHVRIGLPDWQALVRILRVHLAGDLADADLDRAAVLASGSTGADAERFVRGARRRARAAARPMVLADLVAEIGGEDGRTDGERWVCAVHEAGHAVAAIELGFAVRAVSIRAAAGEGGGVDGRFGRYLLTEFDVHDHLVCLLAGRAAEEVVLGTVTSGAGGGADSDLAHATWLAARASSELGLDREHGFVWWPMPDSRNGLGTAFAANASLLDRARLSLANANTDAVSLLRRREVAVRAVAGALVECGALDGEAVALIVGVGRQASEGAAR